MMSNGIQNSTNQVKEYSAVNNVQQQSYSVVSSTPSHRRTLMKLSSYFLAVRPWSLSASLMPTLLGSALAYKVTGLANFSWVSLVLTVYIVVCTHCAGNVVNTYCDYKKGVDSRKSDDRILVDHVLSPDELVLLGGFLYFAGCVGMILLPNFSPARMEQLAFVYFGGLSSSFFYTAGIGFKYIALGDVLILVIFGPLSVLFAFMAQTGYVEPGTIYYAIPLALNTEAILHSNNTRDMESDKKAGIVTLAILIGHTASHVLYAFLLFVPYLILIVMMFRCSMWFVMPAITVVFAFAIEKEFRNSAKIQNVPRQTARLNVGLGGFYVLACLFARPLPYL